MARLKTGVLISGRGSNLAALLEACAAGHFPAQIVCVIANRADAAGLEVAQTAGVAAQAIDHRQFADRESFDRQLDAAFAAEGVELICLAGFMRLLSAWYTARWHNRLINIHPSLLPAFPGLHPQRQALAAGVMLSGCTVHGVRNAIDSGPILGQAAVPVLEGDDEARLSGRILLAEHRLYPHVLGLLASGHLKFDGDRVIAAPGIALEPAVPRLLLSP